MTSGGAGADRLAGLATAGWLAIAVADVAVD